MWFCTTWKKLMLFSARWYGRSANCRKRCELACGSLCLTEPTLLHWSVYLWFFFSSFTYHPYCCLTHHYFYRILRIWNTVDHLVYQHIVLIDAVLSNFQLLLATINMFLNCRYCMKVSGAGWWSGRSGRWCGDFTHSSIRFSLKYYSFERYTGIDSCAISVVAWLLHFISYCLQSPNFRYYLFAKLSFFSPNSLFFAIFVISNILLQSSFRRISWSLIC